ncbi:hypothetical protein Tco_1377244 [Tanacetum coccineum]
MGNCINLMQSPQRKIRVLDSDRGHENFKASTKVKKIISGAYQGYDAVHFANHNLRLLPSAKLLPADVYVLIPRKDQLFSEVVKHDSARESEPHKVKIVVTRRQLEFLVRNGKDFQISKINNPKSSRHRDGYRKWHPSLATIQE